MAETNPFTPNSPAEKCLLYANLLVSQSRDPFEITSDTGDSLSGRSLHGLDVMDITGVRTSNQGCELDYSAPHPLFFGSTIRWGFEITRDNGQAEARGRIGPDNPVDPWFVSKLAGNLLALLKCSVGSN